MRQKRERERERERWAMKIKKIKNALTHVKWVFRWVLDGLNRRRRGRRGLVIDILALSGGRFACLKVNEIGLVLSIFAFLDVPRCGLRQATSSTDTGNQIARNFNCPSYVRGHFS